MKKKLIRGSLYVLGVIALGFLVVNTDWKEVYFHIKSIPPQVIVLLLLSQCITMLLLTFQWRSMALRIKKDVAFLGVFA